jgi:hypothetical protein
MNSWVSLGAMPVAAGVVGNLGVAAVLVLTACDMTPERSRAAALDRRHHLELAEADVAGIGLTPCRSMAAENIRDLQRRAGHGGRLLCRRRVLLTASGFLPGFLRGCDRRSSGLLMLAIMPVAMRV